MYTPANNVDFLAEKLEKLPILDEIKNVFHKNTGLIISFHYSHKQCNNVDFYPVFEKSEFCHLIQQTQEGYSRCQDSDECGLCKALEKKDLVIYECHAGLTNVVIPLLYKGKLIGSIYTGQISLSPVTETRFQRIYNKLKDLEIPYDRLLNTYRKVKTIDHTKFMANVRFLSLMANYIITVEKDMLLQQELISKKRMVQKKEQEKLKLEQRLKDLTISVLEFEKSQREKKEGSMDSADESDQTHRHIVLRAQLFIKKNFNKKITLEDTARAVYFSPNYFSTIFKEISGYTFSSYLTKIRIEEAKHLLRTTNLPIKEIVCQVGFDDYNYFNKKFSQIVSLPPAQFRKKYLHSRQS